MDSPVLVDARGRQHGGAPAVRCAPAANCWLHVSGIDRFVDADEAAAALRAASACQRVEMALFAADAMPPHVERRVRDQGKQHQGWCLMRFPDAAAAASAALKLAGLRCAALGASRLQCAPARSRAELDAAAAAEAAERAAAAAAARERQRAHNQRRRVRARERSTRDVMELIASLPLPGGLLAAQQFVALDRLALPRGVDWDAVPEAARPDAALGCCDRIGPAPAGATAAALAARVARKRAQVDSFAAVLRVMLRCEPAVKERLTVVDYGCGSGGLILPLAWLFPEHDFVGVDMLSASVELLRARAAAAGLRNVTGEVGMIERYTGACDIALGLHACGNATDFVLAQASLRRSAFAVCPCCLGKLRFGLAGGSSFSASLRDLPSLAPGPHADAALPAPEHPRSAWMRRALPAGDDGAARCAAFAALAAAADVSHGEAAEQAQAAQAAGFHEASTAAARAAKVNVEMDRAEGARDDGYAVATLKLFDAAATAKNDLLVGAPRDAHPCWAQALEQLMAAGGVKVGGG